MTSNPTLHPQTSATSSPISALVAERIEDFRQAQEAVESAKAKRAELTKNLGEAKQELSRAAMDIQSANQRKGKAHSVDEMQAAMRELEKAKAREETATALIHNIERTLQDTLGESQSLMNAVKAAKEEVFVAQAKAMLEELQAQEHFGEFKRLIETAFSCEIRTGRDPDYGRFLAGVFCGKGNLRPSDSHLDDLFADVAAGLSINQ